MALTDRLRRSATPTLSGWQLPLSGRLYAPVAPESHRGAVHMGASSTGFCPASAGRRHRVFVPPCRFSHAVVIASSVYARSRKEPVRFSVK